MVFFLYNVIGESLVILVLRFTYVRLVLLNIVGDDKLRGTAGALELQPPASRAPGIPGLWDFEIKLSEICTRYRSEIVLRAESATASSDRVRVSRNERRIV